MRSVSSRGASSQMSLPGSRVGTGGGAPYTSSVVDKVNAWVKYL